MSPELIAILLGFTALVATQATNMLSINKRFDDVLNQIGELRERMARLEDALDGFLAGRRDRDMA